MKRMAAELDVAQSLIFDGEALGIRPRVEHGLHAEPGPGLGGADEIDDGFIVHQWSAAPVQADEREEAMLDLVPLARPRRVVTDRDRHRDLIGERLQAELPGAQFWAVAAAAVGADQESPRGSIEAPAVQSPPAANTLDRKLGGVVADADIHHGPVPRNVIGAVGHNLA